MRMKETGQSPRSFSDRFAILTFVFVIVCLTILSWSRYLHHPEDRLFPLLWPADRYNDLLNYSGKMLHLERGAAFVGKGYPIFNYMPPAAFVYRFILSARNPVVCFQAIVLGAFLLLLVTAAILLIRRVLFRLEDGLGLLALAGSFPIMFVLYRGNLEGIVWASVTAALCLFLRRWYMAAAVALALAIAIKPFPCFLLLLFAARRQYRAALVSLVVAAGLVIWGLAALGPGVLSAYKDLQPGVQLYTHDYLLTFRSAYEQEYAHGILDSLKVLYEKRAWLVYHIEPYRLDGAFTPAVFLTIDGIAATLIAGLMVFRLRRMPTVNQLLGAGIALTLLPPSAADYTLCSLYLPILLIGYYLVTEVRSGRMRWTGWHMLLLVVPLAALMSPMNLFGFWTSVARLMLLLALTAAALLLPLRLPKIDSAPKLSEEA